MAEAISLQGRTAFVTGAGSGIGKGAAPAFARAGARVAFVDKVKIPVEYPRGSTPLPGEANGTIEQVGRLALFLASDWASHINGEEVFIDAGASLVTG